jgi:hypothetical protein
MAGHWNRQEPTVSFDQVRVISKHIQPVSLAEVEQLEIRLGIRLPDGYRGFITHFGRGIYCDTFRIYAPQEILDKYERYRHDWATLFYHESEGQRRWHYTGSESVLNGAQLAQSLIIGDSIDGDKLVFYPAQPDKVFILPRHDLKITFVSADLSDLHLWDTETPRMLTFWSWHNHESLSFLSQQFSLDQAGCLAQLQQRWEILIEYRDADAWSWMLIGFVPSIGARVQWIQDEKITRTVQNEQGSYTVEGDGQRTLSVQIYCDQEAVETVNTFMRDLETQDLCHWENPNL